MIDLKKAQETDYSIALKEIQSGYKRSHWIWYIFPQIQGMGYSSTSKYYAIKDFDEAREYINDEYLFNHLIEISSALLELECNNPDEVMGVIDAIKLKSSMTLFLLVSDNEVFSRVLDKYFDNEKCEYTLNVYAKENQ